MLYFGVTSICIEVSYSVKIFWGKAYFPTYGMLNLKHNFDGSLGFPGSKINPRFTTFPIGVKKF